METHTMPLNNKIRSYFQDPNCAVCGYKIRGWARRQCDNCGRQVCSRHRPPFVQWWECPECKKRQNQFVGAPQIGAQIAGPTPPQQMPDLRQWGYNIHADARLEGMLRAAEDLYTEGKSAEADRLAEALLSELYQDDDTQAV
jgi:hypothetical protein